MPNRVIKESIRTSRNVNALSDLEFRVWVNLITYVDDFGRGSADPELLKGFVFPRRKDVDEERLAQVLQSLAARGMILLYTHEDEPYFCFPKWSDHQRVQQRRSKFPAPPDGVGETQETAAEHGVSPEATAGHGASPEVTVKLLTKRIVLLTGKWRGREKRRPVASSHVLYHPLEVQGRGGQEAVILRCL